jgi:hypothetical protein
MHWQRQQRCDPPWAEKAVLNPKRSGFSPASLQSSTQ